MAGRSPESSSFSEPSHGAVNLGLRLGDQAAAALVAALDHLLRQNDWARARMAPFAGRVVRIGIDAPALPGLPGPFMHARLNEAGLLEAVPRGAEVDLEIAVRVLLAPSVDAIFAFLRDGPQALQSHLRIDGEALLAAALGELAQHLRWDVEEDLSRISGDALAHRIGRGLASAHAAVQDMRARVEGALGSQLTVAGGPLVASTELGAMRAAMNALEGRLDRLDAKSANSLAHADRSR